MMTISLTEEMRRVAVSHERNGERLTANVLFRARDHIAHLEKDLATARQRLERIATSALPRSIKTPRPDGATLRSAFTVAPDAIGGSRCLSCATPVAAGDYHECWSEPASVDTHPKGGDAKQGSVHG